MTRVQTSDVRNQNLDRKGFTLIELMVVIAIIAILATVGFVSFTHAQISARDSKRKQDLRSLKVALELYYEKNHRYPSSPSSGAVEQSTGSAPWLTDNGPKGDGNNNVAFDQTYINTIPVDPINNSSFLYQYYSGPAQWGTCAPNQYYFLQANLENFNDPDTYSNKHYG